MDNQFKPTCKLVGEDGNIFSILGRVIRALNDPEKANEVSERVMAARLMMRHYKLLWSM
ncbi:hypothetical protein [Schinkia azotoformans]|uniref:hypothetical protein n=1 Tax=Schinkia azotoformans TaxID=1454 RepID=UPI002DBD150B|nr:hypothetical protein [Schinkia azotoformans]MEC1788625.1 hypothetical protein [Schinkia azotoformans]MED4419944.1 hypothetical protein [Schinkia azotoformans]